MKQTLLFFLVCLLITANAWAQTGTLLLSISSRSISGPTPPPAASNRSARQMALAVLTIRYVKAGATGTGTSWSNASGDLQAMINASTAGDQV
ncbi:hypothetical protein [Spirosoma sp. KUDC1026]|uniref:hypothetical protein n=1 Tax=Spirosoma sp. KUDC1026 TaxID=2745947 RepID=UPI00159B9ED2|nr:hypothetical protein [Spirosoma sp. KUDC1026]QKZ12737.1 hypothetical protein HU175_08870 [Spirosoma sp. KUDC1026]